MAEKVNPFAKLAGDAPVAKSAAPKVTKVSGTVGEGLPGAKAKSDAAAKKRLADKKAKAAEAAALAAAEAEAEEVDEEELEDEGTPAVLAEDAAEDEAEEQADAETEEEDSGDEDDTDNAAAPEAPAKAAPKRRTAAVVEAEAAAREEALQAQIDEMKAQLAGKANLTDIAVTVVRDRVVLEDGVGGDVRVVGDGRTLVNDDWRATADGLRLLVGRSSAQSTQTFQFPLSLVPALAELLSNISEITE